MKILVFAKDETQLKELLYELELKKELENEILAIGNFNDLQEKNIARKNISSYVRENTNKIATDWLKSWAHQKTIDGKNFKEYLMMDEVSWWWFMEHWLYSSYAYMDPIKGVIAEVFKVKKIIETEKPEKIVFVQDNSLFSRALSCIVKNLGIEHYSINKRKKISLNLKNPLIRQFLRQSFFVRKRIGHFYKNHLKERDEGKETSEFQKKILAVAVYNWTRIIDLENGRIKKGNPYITTITDQLKKNSEVNIKYVDIPYAHLIGISTLKEKIESNDRYDLIEFYYNRNVKKRFLRTYADLAKRWAYAKKNDAFRNSFIFAGINLWELVEPQFSCYFNTRLEAHARDFELIKEMIDFENPELVVYSSDIDEFGRMLFYFCRQKNIPTIAIQHGTLPKTIPLFIYKKFELKGYTAPPMPTKLVLYGEYYNDFIKKIGNYPKEGIVVCGNPRYDYYKIMKETHIREEFFREFNLDKEKRTIMLLTQPLPSEKEREEIIDGVCKAVKEIPNSQLIIKLHPAETSDIMHRRIVRQNNINNCYITKNVDNFKILYISDVLIGPVSTLDYEAMLLEKPVIVLNLTKRFEEIPFVKEGSAIGVYEKEKISGALKTALFNEKFKKTLKSNMQKTVRQHLFRNDGNASRRISAVALKLLKSGKFEKGSET